MNKLISMTDFVLEQKETSTIDLSQIMWYDEEVDKLVKIRNYANFLKQPLKLEMFAPCDDEGNVLLGKPLYPATDEEWDRWEKELPIYQRAKEKVLFTHNLDINSLNYIINQGRTIESLSNGSLKLTLTESAKKQIGI